MCENDDDEEEEESSVVGKPTGDRRRLQMVDLYENNSYKIEEDSRKQKCMERKKARERKWQKPDVTVYTVQYSIDYYLN